MKVLTFILGSIMTNSYLCVDESGSCVIIDPGCDGEGIYKKISDRGLKLEYILFTHGHFDHIMASGYLKEKTGAKTAIHRFDNELLCDPKLNYAMQFAGSEFCSSADILLNDGEIVKCASMEFKLMHTPGHTKGSSVFICERYLFSGDTLFAGDVGRTDLYGGSASDLKKSLARLNSLEGDYKLYPGHGNPSRLQVERETNEDMQGL